MFLYEIKTLLENKLFPKTYCFDSEIYGLHYGQESHKKVIKKIMITIDLSLEAIYFAIKNKINLVISIYGLIHKPVTRFNVKLINKLTLLSKYPISIFVLNNSFIAAQDGISDTIMEALYLKMEKPFMIKTDNDNKIPIGRICIPSPYPNNKKSLNLEELILRVKANINMNNISYVGNLNRNIEKVCILGEETIKVEYLQESINLGCDCLIIGNINYHIASFAKENGICLIRISLFKSKVLALRKLYNFLSLKYPYEKFFFYDIKNPLQFYN